ncbi:type VI secretion system contractile sheath domain-containing protein [Cribrihabitans marinus]
MSEALASIPEVAEVAEETGDDVLDDLAAAAPEEGVEKDDTAEALASLPEVAEVAEESGDDVLDDLAAAAPEAKEETTAEDVLASLPELQPEAPETEEDTAAEEALASLPEAVPEETGDDLDALLGDLGTEAPEPKPDTAAEEALASLPEAAPEEETGDDLDALLGDLGAETPEPEPDTAAEEALASLPEAAPKEETTDDLDALLGDLGTETPEPEPDTAAEEALASLPEAAPEEETGEDLDALLGDLGAEAPEPEPDTAAEEALASLPEAAPEEETGDDLDALLDDLGTEAAAPEPDTAAEEALASLPEAVPEETGDDLDALLDDLGAEPAVGEEAGGLDSLLDDMGADGEGDLDGLLDDLGATETAEEAAGEVPETEEVPEPDGDDLDALLSDLDEEDAPEEPVAEEAPETDEDDLDALLSDLDGEDAAAEEPGGEEAPEAEGDDLDALLDGLGEEDAREEPVAEETPAADEDDLDALLADLDEEDAPEEPVVEEAPEADEDDLDALLADLDEEDAVEEPVAEDASDTAGDDLDALLSDLDADTDTDAAPDAEDAGKDAAQAAPPELAFGKLAADRPDPERLNRRRFRIALFGDFSGRAARGLVETGDALAARPPILLDPDTVEEVIAGFGTTLVLPLGRDGAGIEVTLKELDDLHPDELFEKVDLFEGLAGLKGQLSAGATAEHAAKQLTRWGEEFGQAVVPPRRTSGGNTVRADLKLSDFQKLIGDTTGATAQASPIDDLLARVVGPHIRKLPDPDVQAMQGAVDEALSGAMRLLLHHPEFQSVEAQWRSLDLIARSVEVDDTLEVILHDVSAEEIAADLAAADDLAQSGLVRLLTEGPLDEETGRGGYSALMGLYTFEETPPHAEILGRVAQVAAHVDAPFYSAITPAYLDTDLKDRHPLVAEAWDRLRKMPEAGYLGLASPRFLLRRPYGQGSEPIYEFDFEEFTEAEGLRGMLWANPVVLVTILLARSFRQNGKAMNLGSVMSLGGMPYHFVNDRHGDQVALPCTERNITQAKAVHSGLRGIMPVLSVKGRDEVRLGSFNSLAGAEILGPWSGVAPPAAPEPEPEPEAVEPEDVPDTDDEDDMDLDALLADAGGDDAAGDEMDDLDALLAGFADDEDASGGDDEDEEMDAELAALLADL